MLLLQSIGCQTEKLSVRCQTCPHELLVRAVQNNKSYCHCSWLPPELNGKTPLLNTPHTLVTRLGEIKLTYLETSTLLASFHSTGRYSSEYRD